MTKYDRIKKQSNTTAIVQDCINQGFVCVNRFICNHRYLDNNIIPYNEKKYKGDKKKIALSHKLR